MSFHDHDENDDCSKDDDSRSPPPPSSFSPSQQEHHSPFRNTLRQNQTLEDAFARLSVAPGDHTPFNFAPPEPPRRVARPPYPNSNYHSNIHIPRYERFNNAASAPKDSCALSDGNNSRVAKINKARSRESRLSDDDDNGFYYHDFMLQRWRFPEDDEGFSFHLQELMRARLTSSGGCDANGDNTNNKNNGNESFRRGRSSSLPLDNCSVYEVKGRVMALAKDSIGCRVLQETMKNLSSKEEVSLVFLEIIDSVVELMLDPSGNYVFQKLVDICTEEQRTRIVLALTEHHFQLVDISLDMHGTRAVQKLLECVTTQQQKDLIMAALCQGVVTLTKDLNGLHVIEHCLKYFSNEDNKHLLNIIANNCFDIATNRSGCCVMQHCVDYAQGEAGEKLMAEIIVNASLLAEDCYGNYVVQHVVALKNPRVNERLLRQLENKFFRLSCNKFGSNVVEKFFQDSGEECSRQIILELLYNQNAPLLLVDPYGNYVIKSALSVSQGPIRNALRDLVQRHSPMMRSNLYGQKLLAWFDRWKHRQR